MRLRVERRRQLDVGGAARPAAGGEGTARGFCRGQSRWGNPDATATPPKRLLPVHHDNAGVRDGGRPGRGTQASAAGRDGCGGPALSPAARRAWRGRTRAGRGAAPASLGTPSPRTRRPAASTRTPSRPGRAGIERKQCLERRPSAGDAKGRGRRAPSAASWEL